MIWSPVAIGIIAGLGLILLGPKRIPALAKSIGLSVKKFKEGLGEDSSQKLIEHDTRPADAKPESQKSE